MVGDPPVLGSGSRLSRHLGRRRRCRRVSAAVAGGIRGPGRTSVTKPPWRWTTAGCSVQEPL